MTTSFIRTWDSVPESVCRDVIQVHKNNPRIAPGVAGDPPVVSDAKKSLDTTYSVYEPLPKPIGTALDSLARCLASYLQEFPDATRVSEFRIVEGFNVQQYRKGWSYKARHCERTGKKDCFRHLVWMIYLNTVTDGGGTAFPNQNLIVDAVAGRVVIWPSDWTHAHHGVVSPTQEKFIMTGWYSYV